MSSKHHYDFELNLDNPVSTHSIQFARVPNNSKLLDVGCHTGILGAVLKTRKGCTVVGIDQNGDALKEAASRLDAVQAIDLERSDWTESLSAHAPFDAILFGDVLEHLRDSLTVLKQSRKLLRPGGIVIVSLPNVANLRIRLGLLRGNFDYVDAGILDRTHLRFFTQKTATELVRQAGFSIESISYSGYSLPKWLIERFPSLLSVGFVIVGRL